MTKFTKASSEILTDEDIEALADEAERGYDLDKATKVTVGRPSLGAKGVSPRLSFRATPELYRAVQRRAKKEGRSVSDLAREAVSQFVKS
jgi:hypothetical protein